MELILKVTVQDSGSIWSRNERVKFTSNLTKIHKLKKQKEKKKSEYKQHETCMLNRNMQILRQLWEQSCAYWHNHECNRQTHRKKYHLTFRECQFMRQHRHPTFILNKGKHEHIQRPQNKCSLGCQMLMNWSVILRVSHTLIFNRRKPYTTLPSVQSSLTACRN